ncbi:AKT [Mytilus edulis]|uniref:AKT n=1 Tax=Mytilus edulis TaxID=6550 RepID=A0A8S3R3J4_MYTED|nr:AKT [Mytilus edulis]
MNFERVFDNQPSIFEELRPIFEVLCTMTKSMTEEQIFEVANISSENRRKIKLLIGNELGHFLIFSDGYLSFFHKSIADFLTCLSRQHLRFFVHKENGHTLFGVHHLKSLNISETNLVDVVHHVAMSENYQLKSMFKQNYANRIIYNTKLPLLFLHQVVRDFNSYKTTKLLLSLTNKMYINDTDVRNMTAAFIAASFGNEQALKCLLDYGADPNFKVIFLY